MWGKPRFQEAHEYVNESRAYTNPTHSCYTHFLSCDLRMEGNPHPRGEELMYMQITSSIPDPLMNMQIQPCCDMRRIMGSCICKSSVSPLIPDIGFPGGHQYAYMESV